MSFTVKPATPTDSRLLIGMAGPAGSGKTASALRLATGIVQMTGGQIIMDDTENKRSLQYARDFNFQHIDFQPPFSSLRYLESFQAVDKPGNVIIIDSMSHEHEGQGGHLEQHEAALTRMAGNDYGKRNQLQFSAWAEPKADRRKLLLGVQRTQAHIIMCFRAKDKLELRRVQKNGRTVNEPTPIGWQPIGGDEFAYEMDIMMFFPPNSKGAPDWTAPCTRINDMRGELTKILHSTTQISEETGKRIYELKACAGGKQEKPEPVVSSNSDATTEEIIERIGMAESLEALQGTWKHYAAAVAHLKTSTPDGYAEVVAVKDAKKEELTNAT